MLRRTALYCAVLRGTALIMQATSSNL